MTLEQVVQLQTTLRGALKAYEGARIEVTYDEVTNNLRVAWDLGALSEEQQAAAAVAIGQAFAGTLLVLQPEPPPTFTVCSALPKLS